MVHHQTISCLLPQGNGRHRLANLFFQFTRRQRVGKNNNRSTLMATALRKTFIAWDCRAYSFPQGQIQRWHTRQVSLLSNKGKVQSFSSKAICRGPSISPKPSIQQQPKNYRIERNNLLPMQNHFLATNYFLG